MINPLFAPFFEISPEQSVHTRDSSVESTVDGKEVEDTRNKVDLRLPHATFFLFQFFVYLLRKWIPFGTQMEDPFEQSPIDPRAFSLISLAVLSIILRKEDLDAPGVPKNFVYLSVVYSCLCLVFLVKGHMDEVWGVASDVPAPSFWKLISVVSIVLSAFWTLAGLYTLRSRMRMSLFIINRSSS
jgi:hypothetical protein